MQILFEDHHLLALNKPAGLLTQAPVGVPSLEAEAKAYIKEAYQKPAGVYLGIPHRLDRPVSGVVLFCRNTKAASRVAEQFQQHRVQKIYWAIVRGILPEQEGEWQDYLKKVESESRAEIVGAETEGAKNALTKYRMVIREDDRALLELAPQTGRMHQLRLQAASRGYPIQGDQLYGSPHTFGPEAELPRDRLIALHARRLTIEHPFRKEPLTFEAPLPDYWPVTGDEPRFV
jgi:23S rRNA pseudouridine1911/1915/1917 synthase